MARNAAVDVAVVGGGISGLYVAWSLVTQVAPGAPAPRVAVLESSDQVGGRLRSVHPPGAPHLVAELGGRQFVAAAHPLVAALVERFGLATQPWRHAGDRHLYHLRGARVAAPELSAGGAALPYGLAAPERGRTPQALFEHAVTAAVAGLASMDADGWSALLSRHAVDGRPLVDWSIGELLARTLSDEAVAMVGDGGGIRLLVSDASAGAVLAMFAGVLGDVEPLALERGYQALAFELADAARAAGAEIHLSTRATRLDHDDDGVHVRLDDGARLHARQVVLALPRRAIELLDRDGAPWDGATFADDLDSVEPIVHGKGFATYAEPWWECGGGTSFTDQPIRECIYNGTEHDAPGGEPGNRTSLIEVSYADAGFARLWAGMARDPSAVPYGPAGPTPDDRATTEMVALWQRQLAELHGLDALPAPTWACFRDWSQDPFGAAAHLWRRGVDATEVMPRIRRPGAAPVFVCGEAWSATQGWVEGALQTAQHVLEDHLGVPRPPWLAGVSIGP